MSNAKRNVALSLLLGAVIAANADDGSLLWLKKAAPDTSIVKTESEVSDTMKIAFAELSQFKGNVEVMVDKHQTDLGDDGFEIRMNGKNVKIIAKRDVGLLYGVYYLLRQ